MYSKNIVFHLATYSDDDGNRICPYGSFEELPVEQGKAYSIHPKYLDHIRKYGGTSTYDVALILLDKNEKGNDLFDVIKPLPTHMEITRLLQP